MDKLKIAKIGTKLVVGIVGSTVIGFVIKGEKYLTAAAETYLDKKN